MKRFLITLSLLALSALIAIVIINLSVASYSDNRIQTVADLAAEPRVAVVFGARVGEDGVPSNTLYDRTITAIEAYKANKVNTLLMSGGNDEPEVMKKLAVDLGVPNPTSSPIHPASARTTAAFARKMYSAWTAPFFSPRTIIRPGLSTFAIIWESRASASTPNAATTSVKDISGFANIFHASGPGTT
jgi:hypothetical protein